VISARSPWSSTCHEQKQKREAFVLDTDLI
jgi:hypothetical protein